VAMTVLLLENADGNFCLRPELVSQLARLGVTNAALVRDEQTTGIVLEGWLFDPPRAAEAAATAVGAGPDVQTLHPVMYLAVSTAEHEGGRNVRDVSHARG
jgi:hypothetical protein